MDEEKVKKKWKHNRQQTIIITAKTTANIYRVNSLYIFLYLSFIFTRCHMMQNNYYFISIFLNIRLITLLNAVHNIYQNYSEKNLVTKY